MVESKKCSRCGEEKPHSEFYQDKARKDGLYPSCKPCSRAAKKASNERARERLGEEAYQERRRGYVSRYRERHPERVRELDRKHFLKGKYGITPADYERMLAEQGGTCRVCGDPPTTKLLAVDHNHETGAVRGLLCSRCNTALGLLRECPQRAARIIHYIREHE